MRATRILAIFAPLLLVGASAFGCASTVEQHDVAGVDEIVNGRVASSADGMARIMFADQPWCGGTLVAPNWVLTAAHCIDEKNAADLAVRIGDIDLRSGGAARAVIGTHPHENFDSSSLQNDVALLELAPTAVAHKTTSLAGCADADTLTVGGSVDVFGWGATDASDEHSQSSVLQTATSTVVDCAPFGETGVKGDVIYRNLDQTKVVCVGDASGVANACAGDSGGPLFATSKDGARVQVGIDSEGLRPCGQANRPTVFTRVIAYLSWIHATTGGAAGSASCPAPVSASRTSP